MDAIGRQLIWNGIHEKLNKGERICAGEIVWGVILNGGRETKSTILGDGMLKKIDKEIEGHESLLAKTDNELRILYQDRKDDHFKKLKDDKAFFKKFQDMCKEIKAEINKAKIDKAIKESVLNTLRDDLNMLNREILESETFQDYDEWKKDSFNVSQSRISFLKQMKKTKIKEIAQNTKIWEKIEKVFQIPEYLKDKENES